MKLAELKKRISIPILIVLLWLAVCLFFVFFISYADNARKLEPNGIMLYTIEDIQRYYIAKCAPVNPSFFLMPWTKPMWAIIGSAFIAFMGALGISGITSLRILIPFFSAGTLYATYKLMKKIELSDNFSALVLVLIASNPIYFYLSISAYNETMLTFFIIFAIYFFYAGKYRLSSLFVSLAPLVRFEGGILAIIWFLYFAYKKKFTNLVILIIPTLIYAAANYVFFGSFSQMISYYERIVWYQIHYWGLDVTDIEYLQSIFGPLLVCYGGYVFIFLTALGIFGRRGNKKLYMILLVLLSFFLYHILNFFVFYKTLQTRWFLPVFLLSCIFAASGLVTIAGKVKKYNFGRMLAAALFITVLFSSLGVISGGLPEGPTFSPHERHLFPVETIKWLDRYIDEKKPNNVYVSFEIVGLYLADDNCSLAKKNLLSGPAPYAIRYNKSFYTDNRWNVIEDKPPSDGILIMQIMEGNLTGYIPWAEVIKEFPEDNIRVYRI